MSNNNHINSIVDSDLFTDLVACPLDNSYKKNNTDDKESQTSQLPDTVKNQRKHKIQYWIYFIKW